MIQEELKQEAYAAIEAVADDESATIAERKTSLQQIVGQVEVMIDNL